MARLHVAEPHALRRSLKTRSQAVVALRVAHDASDDFQQFLWVLESVPHQLRSRRQPSEYSCS